VCSYDDSEREFFDFIASIFGWKSSLFGSGKISESDSSDSLSFGFGGAKDQKKRTKQKTLRNWHENSEQTPTMQL
jgi:hypothetical protein